MMSKRITRRTLLLASLIAVLALVIPGSVIAQDDTITIGYPDSAATED